MWIDPFHKSLKDGPLKQKGFFIVIISSLKEKNHLIVFREKYYIHWYAHWNKTPHGCVFVKLCKVIFNMLALTFQTWLNWIAYDSLTTQDIGKFHTSFPLHLLSFLLQILFCYMCKFINEWPHFFKQNWTLAYIVHYLNTCFTDQIGVELPFKKLQYTIGLLLSKNVKLSSEILPKLRLTGLIA